MLARNLWRSRRSFCARSGIPEIKTGETVASSAPEASSQRHRSVIVFSTAESERIAWLERISEEGEENGGRAGQVIG